MRSSLAVVAAVVVVGVMVGGAVRDAAGGYGALFSSASCVGSNVEFHWDYSFDPQNPPNEPDWVGYDVYRRRLYQASPGCDAWVRVNDDPYARLPDDHEYTYVEAPPSQGVTYEYKVVLIDENRNQVQLQDPFSCEPCAVWGWASCPAFSAPVTHGTLEDVGWAMYLWPCGQTCYPTVLMENPPPEFQQFANDGTHVRLYGHVECGGIDGCDILLDRYETGLCGVTPVTPASWGRVKALYR